MQKNSFLNQKVFQNAWVVDDLLQAVEGWINSTGIGPFFLVKDVALDNQLYRGQPVEVRADIAIAQAGDVQIELISQINDAPSAYRDTVPKGTSGFHHMALYCDDYDADLAAYTRAGAEIAFSGSFAGKRICYLDTSRQIGCMIELIEACDAQADFFALVREAAHEWDGSDPIRSAF